MIAIGPDLFEVHTPGEHMSISSAERTFEFLKKVLEALV
jgi:dipeptidase D